MEGSGPPPADSNRIQALPKVIVSQELVGMMTKKPEMITLYLLLLVLINCTRGNVCGLITDQ